MLYILCVKCGDLEMGNVKNVVKYKYVFTSKDHCKNFWDVFKVLVFFLQGVPHSISIKP